MKSGLEDRNNGLLWRYCRQGCVVSMKSGLEDRNNQQYGSLHVGARSVSMKSGLEDRNNGAVSHTFLEKLMSQ